MYDQIRICLVENISAQLGHTIRNIHRFQGMSIHKRTCTDRSELAAILHIEALESSAFIECILFQSLNARGQRNRFQTPAMAKRRLGQMLQGRPTFKRDLFQVSISIKAISANTGNACANDQGSDRLHIILDDPSRVNTVGRIVLHRAFAVNHQGAVAEKNIFNIRSAVASVNYSCIIAGNERTLFIKDAGIIKHVHLTADRKAVLIEEVYCRIDRYVAGVQSACRKVAVCVFGFIKIEAIIRALASTNPIFSKIIIQVTDSEQAGLLYTVNVVRVAFPSILNDHTVNILFAICPCTCEQLAASGALKYAVNNFIAMSCCGNGRAPVNNGLADFAVSSSSVPRFRAGRRLVSNGLRGVDMSAVPGIVVRFAFGGGDHILRHLVHLGVDLRTFTGECIGCTVDKCNDTAVDFHADVDGPEFLHALELSIGICRLTFLCSAFIGITHSEFPCADRQRSKGCFASLCIFTCACDCDSCDVFVALN